MPASPLPQPTLQRLKKRRKHFPFFFLISNFHFEISMYSQEAVRKCTEVSCTLYSASPNVNILQNCSKYYLNQEIDILPVVHTFVGCVCVCACVWFYAVLTYVQLLVTNTRIKILRSFFIVLPFYNHFSYPHSKSLTISNLFFTSIYFSFR